MTSRSTTRSIAWRIRWTSPRPPGGLLLPVAAHAAAQALRLADVQHLAPRVLHQVHAGAVGQVGEGRLELGGHAPIVGQPGPTRCRPAPGRSAGGSAEAGHWARPRSAGSGVVGRGYGPWTIRPSTTGPTGELAVDVVDGDLEQVVARLEDVGALREHRVPVAAGVHEVVGDEPDGVGRPRPGSAVPVTPSGAFQMPSITGRRPLQWYWTLRPEICGKRPVAIAGLQRGREPVQERRSSAGRR